MEEAPSTLFEALPLKKREECPEGTVPVQRTQKEDLINAAGSLSESFAAQHVVCLRTKLGSGAQYYGGMARMSVYNPKVVDDQFSSTNIWVEGGSYEERNVILAGWRVAPQMTHDNLTRLFVFWTGDGYKTGCYNNECPGFVQVDRSVTPNYPIHKISIYDRTQYEMKVLVFMDRKTGNWWLVAGKFNIGYWPKEIFPKLVNGGEDVAFGGIAKKGKTGASPPMGSGYKPDGNYRHACYFREVSIVDSNNFTRQINEDETEEVVDESGCYGLRNDKYNGPWSKTYYFSFGGPGGGDCWG